jgi:nitrate reductase NapAB chaperone NapD
MSGYHICGVLWPSRPEQNAILELHADNDGRTVLTVGDGGYRHCADAITPATTLDGAASSSLVYHQIDTEELL